MEDTLWVSQSDIIGKSYDGLNPYSNGRYSMSPGNHSDVVDARRVLILILLEDTL